MINEGIEGITHNLLICDPIAHPRLYQLTRVNVDLDVFQILFTGGVGMITIIFAQYSLGMGICLNLDVTRAAALDLLAFDLSFLCGLFLIMFNFSGFVTCATESLTA